MDALNHSDRSDMFQDHELIEAVLQKPEDGARLNDSAGSRLSSIFVPQHSLRSTGNLSRPVSIVSNSKHSIALSQEKLSDVVEPLVEEKVDLLRFEHLKFHVYVLALFCVCSLVLGSLSIQLTLALASHHTSTRDRGTVIDANLTYDTVTEVATALSTFVVTLDITCLLVCSLQCLVVVKLLKVSLGEERAAKFLRDCSSSRFIAVTGFFVSIPAFLVALILFMISTFTSAAALTATVVLAAGALFCVLSVMQNVYHLRLERARGLSGLPVFDHTSHLLGSAGDARQKELSTLV